MDRLFLREFLNEKQIDAVLFDKNAVVMACPGGGKTRTLVYKIAHELSSKTDHRFVVAITYTNNAADEIKKRIVEMGVSLDRLWIGTIHSFCLRWILKPYSGFCEDIRFGYRIIDPHDADELKQRFCEKHSCSIFKTNFGWDERGLKVKGVNNRKAVEEYYRHLKSNDLIDFDQVIYFSYLLLVQYESIALNLSRIFNLILVDEYQDTQILQYELLFSLAKSRGNTCRLFFVGDPNQAIFNSMGGVALSFENFRARSGIDFNLLSLNDNYRSSQSIVDFFSLFRTIYGQPFKAVGEFSGYDSKVTFNRGCSIGSLDNYVKDLVYSAISDGISQSDICIIAPWWFHLSEITRRLMALMPDIAFNGPGVTPISLNRESLWYKLARIALTPSSPKNYLTRIYYASELLTQLKEAGFILRNDSTEVKHFLRYCNSLNVREIDGLDYLKVFFNESSAYFDFDIMQNEEFSESYNAFFASAQKRKEKLEIEGLGVLTKTEHYKKMFDKKSGVTVTTVHSAKGLEFDCVIAFGLLQGIIPRFDEDEQQSKRLLYVLCSRAKKKLHLISEVERRHKSGPYHANEVLCKTKFDYTNE
ncbi:TPA: UvrD-helicase domain-containing protein [Serratia odorifera]